MDADNFLIDHYKLTISYLSAQFDRLWQRFQLFLTVHTGLLGFLAWFVSQAHTTDGVPIIATVGIFLSILWCVVAVEERHLVNVYRKRLKDAAYRIQKVKSLEWSDYAKSYVGAPAEYPYLFKPFTTTHLPIWISLLVGFLWLFLLYRGDTFLQPLAQKPPTGASLEASSPQFTFLSHERR